MDQITIQVNWDELITKLREKYPQLTEDDLQHKEGMEEDMLRMIEYKLRMTKEELQFIIKNL